MAKDSHLRECLEVHSLSSDQVLLPIQLKTFSKFSGWTFNFFFAFELHCSLFHILMIKSSYLVDQALSRFSLGHLHMGGFVLPLLGGHRPYGGDLTLIDYIIN